MDRNLFCYSIKVSTFGRISISARYLCCSERFANYTKTLWQKRKLVHRDPEAVLLSYSTLRVAGVCTVPCLTRHAPTLSLNDTRLFLQGETKCQHYGVFRVGKKCS